MGLKSLFHPVDLTGVARESAPNAIEVAADAVRDIAPWYVNRDAFFWPCIAGESMAPTMNGYAYNARVGKSCVFLDPAVGAGAAQATTWPIIGRVMNAAKPVMVIDFDLLIVDVGVGTGRVLFNFGENAAVVWDHVLRNIRLGLQAGAGSPMQLQTADGVGVETSALAAPTLGVWTHYQIKLSETNVRLWRDGALVATHAARFWPSNVGSSSRPAMNKFPDLAGEEAPQNALSSLEISWEAA